VAYSAANRTPSAAVAPADYNETFGLEIPVPQGQPGTEDSGLRITGESLQDELTSLVEENPDVAANVLRNWISDAA
ncbi:MAG: hypothetical protein AAFN70_15550, partial [Planctomycetota bacterium]